MHRSHTVIVANGTSPGGGFPYQLVDPQSKTSWSHDWTSWLEDGETIASRLWTISPAAPLSNHTSNMVLVGPELRPGWIYRLVERVTTSLGVRHEQMITLRVENISGSYF
jgi:hypothetical protein